MRTLHVDKVTAAVAEMCVSANRFLPEDIRKSLEAGEREETSVSGREILRQLNVNCALAAETGLPLCQDTGYAVFFVELGQDLRLEGGLLREAIDAGVRKGYKEGKLRASVCDPFTRKNTGDNTPAVVHFDLVPGDGLKITFLAKGGGSENMSRATMLSPAQGKAGIREFVLRRVAEAGPNPCPPIIVGVGIGGTFDYAPILAKRALLRSLDDLNPDPELAVFEADLLTDINKLGVGPMGMGGRITALGVKIAKAPCHIASLPLAVNIQCHSARHAEVTL